MFVLTAESIHHLIPSCWIFRYIATDFQVGEVLVDSEKHINYECSGTNVYQAVIPDLLTAEERLVYSSLPEKAIRAWIPNRMSDEDVLNFLQAGVAVGFMARSVNVSSIHSLALQEVSSTSYFVQVPQIFQR